MTPLDRLAVCAGKMLAQIEMLLPGIDDDALEEAPLVEAEAESEVHEPARRPPPLIGAAWNRLDERPRTVDSLGIDERDAEWVSSVGTHWRWDDGRWYRRDLGAEWIRAPYDYWPRASGPFTVVDPQTATMDWHGWTGPAIREVLSEHIYTEQYVDPDGWLNWVEDIAPILAARIGCDPQRAIEALSHYKPDKVSP